MVFVEGVVIISVNIVGVIGTSLEDVFVCSIFLIIDIVVTSLVGTN